MRRILLALACAAAASATAVVAQQTPTFRSRVDTVDVHVTVRDANGRLVPDLTQDDFELYDEGKKQPISIFSSDSQPIAISIVLDRSGSTAGQSTQIVDAARAFVRELTAGDRIAVHTLSFECQGLTTETDRVDRVLRGPMPPDLGSPIWAGLDQTMTSMAGVAGRRAILLFSDGDDTGIPILSGLNFSRAGSCRPWAAASAATFDDDLKRAQRDGLMVYTVGVEAPNGRSNDDDLRKIAQRSGGERYRLKRVAELTAAFTRIADELHHQYLLGFVPAVYDGRVHELDVRVKRPGLTARARMSYVAERYDASAANNAAPLPSLSSVEVEKAIKDGRSGQKLQAACNASETFKTNPAETAAFATVVLEGPVGRIMRMAREARDQRRSVDASQVSEQLRRPVLQVTAELKAQPVPSEPRSGDRTDPTTPPDTPPTPVSLTPATSLPAPSSRPPLPPARLSSLLLRSKVQTEVTIEPEPELPGLLQFTPPSLTKLVALFDLAAFRALPGADVEVIVRSSTGLRRCTIGARDRAALR